MATSRSGSRAALPGGVCAASSTSGAGATRAAGRGSDPVVSRRGRDRPLLNLVGATLPRRGPTEPEGELSLRRGGRVAAVHEVLLHAEAPVPGQVAADR